MDLDHAAALAPLALGIFAAILTVYQLTSRKLRHAVAGALAVGGLVASGITWFAVSSSESFQRQVLIGLTGGNNYCFVSPLWNPDKPFDNLVLVLKSQQETPLYDVTVTIDRPSTIQERLATKQFLTVMKRFHFEEIRGLFTPLGMTLGEGWYFVSLEARNGEGYEIITINRGEKHLEPKVTVNWAPEDDLTHIKQTYSYP